MYKRLLILAIVSLGAMLCACEASFVNPVTQLGDTTKVPKIDSFGLKWYNTKVHPYQMNGYVVSNHDRCQDTLPAGSRVIIGWELPNFPDAEGAFYIHGSGYVDPNVIKGGFNDGRFRLNITIDSILPKGAVWFNTDSTQAIAIAHLFLIATEKIKEGDTLLRSTLHYSDILGGVAETAVVFQKGTPVLLGQPLTNPLISVPGFNLLRGYSVQPDPDSHKDMKAVFKSPANSFYLFIDHDEDDTYKLNPMWLTP